MLFDRHTHIHTRIFHTHFIIVAKLKINLTSARLDQFKVIDKSDMGIWDENRKKPVTKK